MVTEGGIREKLKERPVLVTGADGFVGSRLTEELLKRGAKTYVFIRATSSGALHHISLLRKKSQFCAVIGR